MLKNSLTSAAVSIMVFFGLSSGSAFAKNADYIFITNSEGLRLGMTYKYHRADYEGELAIHLETGYFLFIRCKGGEKKQGSEFMRRRDRNCSSQIAPWPSNIVEFAQARHIKVNLDAAPRNCGICLESPFLAFDLPDGVKVIIPPGPLSPPPDPPTFFRTPGVDPGDLNLRPPSSPMPGLPGWRNYPDVEGRNLIDPGTMRSLEEMNTPDGGVRGGGVLGGGMSGGGVGR